MSGANGGARGGAKAGANGAVRPMHLAVELTGDGWGRAAGSGTVAGAGAGVGVGVGAGAGALPGPDFAAYVRLARTAERGLFDFLLLTDRAPGAERRANGLADTAVRSAAAGRLEPVTVLNALAAVTEHIGLAAILAAADREPQGFARRIAALDLLSGGRAAGPAVEAPDAAAPRSPQGRPVLIREEEGAGAEVVVRDRARGSAGSGARVLVRVAWVLDDAVAGAAGRAPANGAAGAGGAERAAADGLEQGSGGAVFTGSAGEFAAWLDGFVQSGAVDGFVLRPGPDGDSASRRGSGPDDGPGSGAATGDRGLDAFVDRVVPLLQQRGCRRTAYRGTTLREHLGLPRPAGRA